MAPIAETLWVVPWDGPEVRALAAADRPAAVWSLETFAETLSAQRRPLRRVLDDVGVWLAVAASVDDGSVLDASAAERLGGLVDAVREARSARVRASAVARLAARVEGASRMRLQALAQALQAYEGVLRRRGLADDSGRWDDARAVLAGSASWPAPLEPFRRVTVTLHPPVAPVTLEAFVALAALGERTGRPVLIEVPSTGEATLDAATEPLFAAFEAHPELSPLVVQREGPGDGPLALSVEHLGERREEPAPLSVWSTAGAPAEARAVAAEALRAVRAGAMPSRCAVLVPEAALGEGVAGALAASGLPVGRRPGSPLAATAAGRAGLLAASLAGSGFPAGDVAWLLGSGLLPRLGPGPPAGASGLLDRAGIRDDVVGGSGGQGAYAARLGALAGRERSQVRAAAARELARSCAALFPRLRALPERGTLEVHLRAWQRALEALGFWEAPALGALPSGPGAGAALRGTARDVQAREAWRTLVRDARGALAALGAPGPELDRGGFAGWLATFAAARELPGEPGRPGGVGVVLLERAPERGAFDWLGGVGLSDGRFPRPVARAGALTDDDRRLVNHALGRDAFPLRFGAGDIRPPAALALDGWRVGIALGRSGAASLGFARDDGFRGVAGPAPFLEALARSAGVARVDLPLEPAVPLERAGSEGELREAVALAAGGASTDPPARALAHLLDEPWLVEGRALGGMETERVRAFEDPGLPSERFTGALGADLAPALARVFAFGAESPLSASTLGRLGQCAFQGFVRIALRIEEPESPGESLDARGQGSFWHAVLERLFPRLQAAGLLGVPAREVPPGLIEGAIDDAAQAFVDRSSPGHPRLFALARERARWMVRRVLDAPHHGLPFEGLRPEETETRFGRADSPEGWREVRLPPAFPGEGDVYLTGAVDRIDAGASAVGVLDYKASRRRDQLRELLKTDFQLPFYLHAVRARGERRALRAGWLVLKTGEFQLFESPGGTDVLLALDAPAREQARATGLSNLANAVHGLVQTVRGGDVGARSEDCGFCPFGPVCRIGERRREGSRW